MKLPSPFAEDSLINIVVETPKGSRNKYVWDNNVDFFRLKKILPEGTAFPGDFGFIPRTMAEDDAPLDAILLADEPIAMGAVVQCRVVGVMMVEQTKGDKTVRNDRIIAVPDCSKRYKDVKSPDDISATWIDEVNEFFIYYHKLEGTGQKVIEVAGADKAMALIKDSIV